jgi:hypothetical protein
MNLIGKSFPRKEGRKKVTGQALYVDDLRFEGMLHGVTVRSAIPRGRIRSISFDQPPATAGGTDRKGGAGTWHSTAEFCCSTRLTSRSAPSVSRAPSS